MNPIKHPCKNHIMEGWISKSYEHSNLGDTLIRVKHYYGCKTCGEIIKISERRLSKGE